MKKLVCVSVLLLLGLCPGLSFAQSPAEFRNARWMGRLNHDSSYLNLRSRVAGEFAHAVPGRWGEFVHGVDEDIRTRKKCLALTFDACGGGKGNGFDRELIDFLRKEHIPATLFVTGKWIDANFATFMELSRDTLFEIENHGFTHKPCALSGESKYGIHGTANAFQAFDEVEANARKIEVLTHRRPLFYRSATAFIDEACARMTEKIGIQTISFQILSGDAVPGTPAAVIEENVVKNAAPGAIVIMHFNHPEWNTFEALQLLIPRLRKMGYGFVRLEHNALREKGR